MATIGSDSPPCPERCPKCHERCYGRTGHTRIATAGKGYAQPHQCRKHFWGELGEWPDITRAEAREVRHEVRESIKNCRKCVAAVERLGV